MNATAQTILIQETNLQFSSLVNRTLTKRIVIHHSASTDVSAATIHQWHLSKGWSGIGYHYVIRSSGSIERGRPEWARGAHAPPANDDSIGICLAGNFDTSVPATAQMDALELLIKDIRKRYQSALPVLGHKDLMSTACPGSQFPWIDLETRLKEADSVESWKTDIINNAKKQGLITSDHNPDDTATKWFVLAVALNLLKIIKGV